MRRPERGEARVELPLQLGDSLASGAEDGDENEEAGLQGTELGVIDQLTILLPFGAVVTLAPSSQRSRSLFGCE